MKTLFTMVLAFVCLSASAQDVSLLDKKNGFKGFILGDTISKFNNIMKYDKRYKSYRVTGSPIKVDGYSTTMVLLNFIDGRLSFISIFVRGEDECNHIHQVFKNAYGNGVEFSDEDNLRHVEWVGKRTKAVLKKTYSVGDVSENIYIHNVSGIKVDNATSGDMMGLDI